MVKEKTQLIIVLTVALIIAVINTIYIGGFAYGSKTIEGLDKGVATVMFWIDLLITIGLLVYLLYHSYEAYTSKKIVLNVLPAVKAE